MCILFLAGVGNLYSASGTRLEDGLAFSDFYQRQLVWGALALIGMIGAMSFDYRRLRETWRGLFFWITLILLLLVPISGQNRLRREAMALAGFDEHPALRAGQSTRAYPCGPHPGARRQPAWLEGFYFRAGRRACSGRADHHPARSGTTMLILLILGGMILFHGVRGYVLKTCLLAAPPVGFSCGLWA